jgi:hypothetical protein
MSEERFNCLKCGKNMSARMARVHSYVCPNSQPPESLDAAAREAFSGIHISRTSLMAGQNYRLFLRFLDSFMESGKLKGVIEFTCPEVQELKAQSSRQAKRIEALEAALKRIANNEFLSYGSAEPTPYRTGVTDGHRLAAEWAMEALAEREPGTDTGGEKE